MKKQHFLLALLLLLSATTLSAQPKIIAHRGYWRAEGSAQNSITALAKAAEAGCYGSEFDVHLTADGELVVFHNKALEGEGAIAQMTAAEVTACKLPNGESVPTLEAYLNEALNHPSLRLILELKPQPNRAHEATAAAKCVEMIERWGLAERTDYISFSLEACRDFHRLSPNSKVFYLGGKLSPKRLKEEGFAGADYCFAHFMLHPSWIAKCKRLGLETNVWTIDCAPLMRHYARRGVDYITTNRPDRQF